MARLTRAIRTFTLSLLASSAVAPSADPAEAQDRDRKSRHDKQKRVGREARRHDRGRRPDDRMAVRRDDRHDDRNRYRDRYPDRNPDRYPDRSPDRSPEGRTLPPIRLPWP